LGIFKDAYKQGLWAPQIPKELGGTPPEGGFDAFHDLILNDELTRVGSGSIATGFQIWTMGIPPVLFWGSPELKEKVSPILRAEKFISLAISEPWAGSDVANIKTTAVKQGDHYIVNGEKKWITFGYYANFYTTAVRTGGAGRGGISLLLIERDTPGITVRRMKLQGNWMAGTSYITFDDVKVPVKNLIGKENEGFKYIMYNFNHERYVISVSAVRAARLCLEEAISYGRNRTVFGQRLIDSQVIRHKIANVAMNITSCWSLLEELTNQMKNGIPPDQLGGPMALAKVMATKTYTLSTKEASQIFGGSAYVREGKGKLVERMYREALGTAIPGGSEEIMFDLGMKMAKL